jgi:hypothetical protein
MDTIFILLASFGVLLVINVPVAFSMTLACILGFLWREPFHLHGHLEALFRALIFSVPGHSSFHPGRG